MVICLYVGFSGGIYVKIEVCIFIIGNVVYLGSEGFLGFLKRVICDMFVYWFWMICMIKLM